MKGDAKMALARKESIMHEKYLLAVIVNVSTTKAIHSIIDASLFPNSDIVRSNPKMLCVSMLN